MHTHQRVEQQQSWPQLLERGGEPALIAFEVEAHAGRSDDVQVELPDVEASMAT
jgi:hypothetical protein